MAFADDFAVDRATGAITHTSGTSTYTVLELHRYLQDLADDASASGDDEVDITDATPSERSTDNIITLLNGYYIDDTAAQFLYDGSITQDSGGGETIYAGVVVVGSMAAGVPQFIQDNAVIATTGTTLPASPYNADATNNIIYRCLVKVKNNGTEIDGRRLRVQAREIGYNYDEFSINGTALGNNVAALSTVADLNNQTAEGTIGGWTITNTEGYQQIDINSDGTDENYYSKWDKGSQSINDVYEYAKYIMRDDSAETIHGMQGELFRGITHSVAYTGETSGPFTEDETLSWGSGATSGEGVLLALDDDGTTGTLHIQLTKGVVPNANTISGATASATASTVTARTINKNSFVGTSTGSNIIGAYGIGFDAADVSASDTFTDLDGNTITPPNNVTFTVANLISTASAEDEVLVTPYDGSSTDTNGDPTPEYAFFTTSGTLNGATVTSVTMSASIPTWLPSTGTLRVVNDEGYHVKLTYTSYTGSTFTINSYDFSGSGVNDSVTTGNNAYPTLIDEQASASTASFTGVYTSDEPLVVRVRNGKTTPIKTFVTTSTFASSNTTVTTIRTSDS